MERKDISIKRVDGQINNSVSEILPQRMMTVRQMGDLLGLRKTERYWLVHKGVFTTEEFQGQILVDIHSFERWYSNQLTYKKITGEIPGAEISKRTYSVSEAWRNNYILSERQCL